MTADGSPGVAAQTGEADVVLPLVDHGALVMADLAWIEADDTLAGKTQTAITAYLWAIEYEQRHGFYPSLNSLREHVLRSGQEPSR